MSALLAAAAVALSGAAVASRASDRGDFRACLGILAGLGLWSSSYVVALFAFGADPRIRIAKDAALAALGIAVLLQPRPGWTARAASQGPTPRWVWPAVGGAVLLATAFFVEHTVRYPDGGWDAWGIWNLRARFLARGGEGFRSAFSADLLFWAHVDYPLLLPGIVAQGFVLAGAEPTWLPAAVAYGFAALAAAVPSAALRGLRGPGWAALAAVAVLATPCFVGFAANQQADVPIGAFLAGTFALSAFAIERGSRRELAVAGFCASLAAWTKNEGLVYLVALGAALLAVRWAPFAQRVRAALRYACGALPVLVLLAWFKLRVAHANDLLSNASLDALLDTSRWAALVGALARRLVFFQNWALWLLAALLMLLFAVVRLPARAAPRVLGAALALSLAATAAVYVVQPHELSWFVRGSFDRVLTQLWPTVVLSLVLRIAAPAEASAAPLGASATASASHSAYITFVS